MEGKMTSAEVAVIVRAELDSFAYVDPEPGTVRGAPWTETDLRRTFADLEAALFPPFVDTFTLDGTTVIAGKKEHLQARYWVVAFTRSYVEYYDPVRDIFGLAIPRYRGKLPHAIDLEGDLIGVFWAM
jgi:hypothetical protein